MSNHPPPPNDNNNNNDNNHPETVRQGGQQLIHPLTNTATASSLCCLRLADRLGVPRDAAYKLYYNSVPKKDTAHPKQTKHYTTAYAAEKKIQTDKKRQAAATATAAAVTTAAASNDANTNTDTTTTINNNINTNTMPAASQLAPAQIASVNAALLQQSALGTLIAGQKEHHRSSVAREAAANATKRADKKVAPSYLTMVGKSIVNATSAAWAAAKRKAALSSKSVNDLFEHPTPGGYVIPPTPQITDHRYTEETRAELSLPWVFNYDVEGYNRTHRIRPCCDGCCTNDHVAKKDYGFKEVFDFGRNLWVFVARYRCWNPVCPAVNAAKDKFLAKQLKKPVDQRKTMPVSGRHEHTYSALRPKSFAQLPTDLQMLLPAKLRSAVHANRLMSTRMSDFLIAVVAESNGLSPARFSKAVEEGQRAHHGRLVLGNYGRAVDQLGEIELMRDEGKPNIPVPPTVRKFGDYDGDLYRGAAPSEKVCWANAVDILEQRMSQSKMRLAMVRSDGITKQDATFNFPSQINTESNNKELINTMTNEHIQTLEK